MADSPRRAVERGVARWMMRRAAQDGTVARPSDAPVVHAPGADPYRLLMVGGLAVAGLGVASHTLSLAGHLSRQVAAISGHGVDIDIAGIPFANAARLRHEIELREVAKYDAILIAAGGIEALTLRPARVWREDLLGILRAVHEVEPRMPVLVCTVPHLNSIVSMSGGASGLIDRATDRLNNETRSIAKETPTISLISSLPYDERRRPEAYFEAARTIAPAVCVALATSEAPRHPRLEIDEQARQRAFDALGLADATPDRRFDAVTEAAAELLNMSMASLAFVDHERLIFVSAVGFEAVEQPRRNSMSDLAIAGTGAQLVEDLRERPDLDPHRKVMTALGLRSYAGYPIEAPTGERIGVLSVGDPRPHQFSRLDLALLRTLALRVQDLVTVAK